MSNDGGGNMGGMGFLGMTGYKTTPLARHHTKAGSESLFTLVIILSVLVLPHSSLQAYVRPPPL